MNAMTSRISTIIQEDFENDFNAVMAQMPQPPQDATPEQIIRHAGAIFHRLAFLKGMTVGVEASQVYIG